MSGGIARTQGRRYDAGGEVCAHVLAGALFLLVNWITGTRSPPVWCDEIFFVDPAWNLAEGRGFTSVGFGLQREGELWAAAPPLYPLVLASWLKVWGGGVLQARSLNYVFALVAAGLIVRATALGGVIGRPWARVGLFVILLTASGIAFAYRCGRLDTMLSMLVGVGFYCAMARPCVPGLVASGLCAMAMAWAGFQVCAYAALLGLVGLVWLRGRFMGRFLAFAVGGGVGLCVLYAYFRWAGGLEKVIEYTRYHMNSYFLGSNGFEDSSYRILLLCCLVAVALGWALREKGMARGGLAGLALGVGLPCCIMVLGHFPIYYSWMGILPAAVGLMSCADDRAAARFGGRWEICAVGVVVAAVALPGLPARLGLTVLQWRQRAYENVEAMVEGHVARGSLVGCSYPAYYAVRRHAGEAVLVGAPAGLSARTRERIGYVVADREAFQKFREVAGGSWEEVASVPEVGRRVYPLVVFRRERP